MDILNWLGIPEELRDSAILSLTHRGMRSIDTDIDGNRLKHYHDIGGNVYKSLLMKFISCNFSLSINGIYEAMKASKSHSIIYNRLKLNELAIATKNVSEAKIAAELVHQFFGFVYIEISFDFAYELFTRAFTKKDVVLFSDYLSFVYELSKGEGLGFEEIEAGGTAHEPYFKYKMTFNGKEVCAIGSSKKAAKKACAQIYCEENISEKDILRTLGYYKKSYHGKRRYNISNEHQTKITNIANKWNFSKQDIYNAIINKFLYNEFDFEDCSHAITIGGFFELILLEKTVYRIYSHYNPQVQRSIIVYLSNNDKLFKTIIKVLELNDLFVLKEKVSARVPLEVIYKDTVRQLIYFAFENSNALFFQLYEKIIEHIMKEVNPYLLDPASKIKEMYEWMQEEKPDIEIIQNNNLQHQSTFIAKFSATFNGTTVYYQGEGSSKAVATNNAYEKFWLYLYGCINDVFRIKKANEFEWFFKIISSHIDWLVWYLKNNEHFAYKIYKQNDFPRLINYLHTFYFNVSCFDKGKLIPIIKAFFEREISVINNRDSDILLCAIWEYITLHHTENCLTTSDHLDAIIKLSAETWKELLKSNGFLIRYMSMPDEELQLIAVQQCPKAINYISDPSNDVINYVYHQEEIGELEIRPQVINGLIEVKKQEIAEDIKQVSICNQTIFLLEQHCFDLYLRAILDSYKVQKLYIACGFVYASGLKMLRSEIHELLENGAEVKILAGNLQHYFSDNRNLQMDLETAKELNYMIKKGAMLKTITNCFYHGKMYFLVCDEFTFVIIGSTNVSRNAFRLNNEFDNMFIYYSLENSHMKHFEKLWQEAVAIENLDETKFSVNVANFEGEQLSVIDINTAHDKIRKIEDANLKNRLLTWLKYAPSNIYDNIDVAGREYIAIEFSEKKMVVLESFYPGNSYFVFYNLPIDELIKIIDEKSKTEIFKLSGMEKRGYHIREQLNLEMKIKSYFL